jgi:hypothetical protein
MPMPMPMPVAAPTPTLALALTLTAVLMAPLLLVLLVPLPRLPPPLLQSFLLLLRLLPCRRHRPHYCRRPLAHRPRPASSARQPRGASRRRSRTKVPDDHCSPTYFTPPPGKWTSLIKNSLVFSYLILNSTAPVLVAFSRVTPEQGMGLQDGRALWIDDDYNDDYYDNRSHNNTASIVGSIIVSPPARP